ncbi:MAG TPA: condensation domain-containing protein, partial [Candidatus Paceibacterota bacterium]|nr:condensation domain-containing protein [Candidatus Paceibacterota bacterium]
MNLTSQPTVPPMANDRRTLLEDRLHEATNGPEVVPLSFAQQRLWLLDQLEPNSPLYNVPLALELTGELDTVALQQALDELVNRHEILRTRFICDDESPVQVIDQSGSLTVSFYDLSATGVPGENLPNGISHSKHPNRPEARSAEFPLGQFQPLPQRAEREPGAPVHREETEARRILQAEATCPFDLSAGRLMRA